MRTSRLKTFAARAVLPVLCAALLLGALSAGARAVSTEKAQLRPDYTIVIDGSARTFYNVGGQQVHPISYQDTTYLPVRAIGELMGKVVSWDEDSKTVGLSGVRTGDATAGTPDAAASVQSISVEVREDFTVKVDGTVRTFADAAGKTVYPLLYQGSTYLPIRAIGELMGKAVAWDEASKTITLSGTAGSTVTDADVIVPSGGSAAPGSPEDGRLTADEAKAAALKHAGLTAEQVTFTEAKLDWEDGRQVYDIEFYSPAAEYDYEIDAKTGEIVKFDQDAESYDAPQPPSESKITKEEAQEIALKKVPGAKADNIRKLKLDREDGKLVYEVEIVYNEMEYELEIDAASGKILKFEAESIYD